MPGWHLGAASRQVGHHGVELRADLDDVVVEVEQLLQVVHELFFGRRVDSLLLSLPPAASTP